MKYLSSYCLIVLFILFSSMLFSLESEVLESASLKDTYPEQIAPKTAKRIIALSPHSVEMLFSIGAGDRILATVEYADYPKEALAIPRVGNYTGMQIEKIIELKPDLIVAWKSGNKASDLSKLESLGLNLFYTHPKNIQQIGHDLIQLGKLTGLKENAEKTAEKINKKYQFIKKKYAEKKRINVFYQLWHKPFRTVGKGSWVESLINDCQGENIFNDGSIDYPLVSMEQVLIKNPKVIIVPHHSGSKGAKLDVWNNWKTIDAVKNKRLFTLNGDLLHRFGPRAVDGLAQLCEAIDQARKE